MTQIQIQNAPVNAGIYRMWVDLPSPMNLQTFQERMNSRKHNLLKHMSEDVQLGMFYQTQNGARPPAGQGKALFGDTFENNVVNLTDNRQAWWEPTGYVYELDDSNNQVTRVGYYALFGKHLVKPGTLPNVSTIPELVIDENGKVVNHQAPSLSGGFTNYRNFIPALHYPPSLGIVRTQPDPSNPQDRLVQQAGTVEGAAVGAALFAVGLVLFKAISGFLATLFGVVLLMGGIALVAYSFVRLFFKGVERGAGAVGRYLEEGFNYTIKRIKEGLLNVLQYVPFVVVPAVVLGGLLYALVRVYGGGKKKSRRRNPRRLKKAA